MTPTTYRLAAIGLALFGATWFYAARRYPLRKRRPNARGPRVEYVIATVCGLFAVALVLASFDQ